MFPKIKVSSRDQLEELFKFLKIDYQKPELLTPWVTVTMDSSSTEPILVPFKCKSHRIPDFKGLGLEDVIYLSEKLGLHPYAVGRGRVYQQSPSPNSRFERGDVVRLKLK